MSEHRLRKVIRKIVSEAKKKKKFTNHPSNANLPSWLLDLDDSGLWNDLDKSSLAPVVSKTAPAPSILAVDTGTFSYSEYIGQELVSAIKGLPIAGNVAAEYFLAIMTDGKVQGDTKTFDVMTGDGKKIEVKQNRAFASPSFKPARLGAGGFQVSEGQQESFQLFIKDLKTIESFMRQQRKGGIPRSQTPEFSRISELATAILDYETSKNKTIRTATETRELTSKALVSRDLLAMLEELNSEVKSVDCDISDVTFDIGTGVEQSFTQDQWANLSPQRKRAFYNFLTSSEDDSIPKLEGCELANRIDHQALTTMPSSSIRSWWGSIIGKSDAPDQDEAVTKEALKTQNRWMSGYMEGHLAAFAFVDLNADQVSLVTVDGVQSEIEAGRLMLSGITQGKPRIGYWPEGNKKISRNIGLEDGLIIRLAVRKIISEELTRTDKNEIERISRRQAKKYFDQQISKSIEAEIGRSFLGTRGKINKHVDNAITDRFKKSKNDKDFDEAVIRVCRRVLKALTDMHYKRTNLIDQMPIPKS